MKTLKEYILNKGLPQEFDEDLNIFWNIKDGLIENICAETQNYFYI